MRSFIKQACEDYLRLTYTVLILLHAEMLELESVEVISLLVSKRIKVGPMSGKHCLGYSKRQENTGSL